MAEGKKIGGPAQVVLKKGSMAPIDGVLVPYDLFREYEINELESDMVRKQMADCESSLEKANPETSFVSPGWFMGGILMGVLATGILR